MTYRLPSPYRQHFSTDGQQRNPAVTNPLPDPRNMPTGCWFGGKVQLAFAAYAGAEGYFRETDWATPIFDLQPQLRGLYPQASSGGVNGTKRFNAVPIWQNFYSGKPQRLHVQFAGLNSPNWALLNIKLLAQEWGHISDAGEVQAITAESDITGNLVTAGAGAAAATTQTPSVILNFSPYGEESPIRFWQLRLRIVMVESTGLADPSYTLNGAYY